LIRFHSAGRTPFSRTSLGPPPTPPPFFLTLPRPLVFSTLLQASGRFTRFWPRSDSVPWSPRCCRESDIFSLFPLLHLSCRRPDVGIPAESFADSIAFYFSLIRSRPPFALSFHWIFSTVTWLMSDSFSGLFSFCRFMPLTHPPVPPLFFLEK